MKIVSAASRNIRIPLTRPYAIAGGSWDIVEMVLLELTTDDGRIGYGQASPAEEVTGETAASAEAALAPRAERAGMRLMWGCMDESVLGIAAALHAALACDATAYLDLDGSFDLATDPFSGGFRLEGDCMSTLARPGLGATPTS